jgi:signal transduction histidine kinase
LRPFGSLSRASAALLIALAIVAALLSLASYQYSSSVSNEVSDLSTLQAHSNSQIQASDLSHLLAKSLEAVSSNLQVISTSTSVVNRNLSMAEPLFFSAQNSTKDLVFVYFWVDPSGRLLLVSNGTVTTYPNGSGADLSQRQFFLAPELTGSTYYSSATPSLSNSSTEYIFISQPIYGVNATQPRVFGGVVAAAIKLSTLGRFLQSEISPNFQSSIGILDFNGTILYSGNDSLIGHNVFGSTYQASLPTDLKPTFDSFLHKSLQGNAGVDDISYRGVTATLAYQPVFVNESSGRSSQFGVLYVVAADTLGTSAVALINQQRLISTGLIIGIGTAFFGTAFMILRWNKRLSDAVKEKTTDLISTNIQLTSANEQLASQSKAQTDLINIAAHELRTPTQSILANAELLRGAIVPAPLESASFAKSASRSGNLSETNQEFLSFPNIPQEDVIGLVESTIRNANRLDKLTQALLEVAKIDNKTLRLDYEAFDLNDFIRQIIDDMPGTIGPVPTSSKVEISLEAANPHVVISADKTKIGEVLSNLLSNAIRHSNNRGQVIVSTKTEDGHVVVKVRDEGGGIDPEVYPRLFDKFVTKSGTGLGLFVSKSYVAAHGGTISAENNPDGRGATFTFTLPIGPVK